MSSRPRIRSTRLLAIILVSACILVITIDYKQGDKGPLEAVGRTALGVMSPLQKAVSKVTHPIGNFLTAVTSLPKLKQERDDLAAEVASLKAQRAAASNSLLELQRLQALLELQQSIDRPSTAAHVISNGVSNFEWTLTIDKGADQGVMVNDAVVTNAGVVGRVVRVSGGAAEVRLITDPSEGVAGKIEIGSGPGQQGVVVGQGDQNMRMDLIDPETPTQDLNNKTVFTVGWAIQGRTNVYPPDRPIGTVVRVLESSGDLAKQVEIAPLVDLSAVDVVLVIHHPQGV